MLEMWESLFVAWKFSASDMFNCASRIPTTSALNLAYYKWRFARPEGQVLLGIL